mmetsp:Transcript_26601/g.40765  ORF Transcript_26601/g.40765 Transcript_26601/m.40765 type:complete len:528 (+) Transcript_26601:56-1639(+)
MSGNIWFVSQQRSCTSRNAIFATFVVALLMSVVSGSFHGKSSQQNSSYRALGQEDINVVDYTGSMEDILDMAHEKADRENAIENAIENADSDPDADADFDAGVDGDGDSDGDGDTDMGGNSDAEVTDIILVDPSDDVETLSCPGTGTFSDMQKITYKYSLTFDSDSDRDDVGRQLVVALNKFLGQELLDCDQPGRKLRQRKLEKGLVVAVNTREGILSSETCDEDDSEDVCKVYDGEIRLLLADNVDFGSARFSALSSVREFIDQVAIHGVDGLTKAAYLAPDFANPNAASNEADNQANKSGISSSVVTNTTGIVIFSCAAAAFVLAFGVFVYSRRTKNIDSDFSAFSRDKEAVSDLQIAPTQTADEDSENGDERTSEEDGQEDGSLDPRSPFSKMLPAAYQLGDSMSMSVILENENESVASSNVTSANDHISSSISDGFVTDMDSSIEETYDASDTVGGTPVLGARRRNGEEFELDSAEESDYSESEGPTPVKFQYHNTRSILGGMDDSEERTPIKELLDNATLLG